MLWSVLVLAGCGSSTLTGSVDKGPFVLGSTVTVSPTDPSGAQTGDLFMTQTLDDLGTFEVRAPGVDQASLEGGGFYFDEVTGELSTAPITLRAWYVDTGVGTVHINAVTHLTNRRVLALAGGGVDLATASRRSADALVAGLGLGPVGFTLDGAGTDLQLVGEDSDDNAWLFALSAVLLSTAHLERPDAPDAALQELMNTIAQDLADDGMIEAEVRERLRAGEAALDVAAVAAHLADRVEALGGNADLPDLGRMIDGDGDGYAYADDCDDADPDVHPGAQEVCDDDGADEDCDGLADDADPDVLASGQVLLFADGDGDGYGVTGATEPRCHPGGGFAVVDGDCDDTAQETHPDAAELCDGADNDCVDGVAADELDGDGDHFVTCTPWVGPAGAVTGGGDCDDDDARELPGGVEVAWDDLDQDCSGGDLREFVAVSSGIAFSCGLGTTGRVLCWGELDEAPTGAFEALDAGYHHACALDASGLATCWGTDDFGALAAPTEALRTVSAGDQHACGLAAAADTLVCWGRDDVGQVSGAPTGAFDAVSAGFRHSCALADGHVTCWGISDGIDDTGQVTDAPTGGGFTKIDAGYFMSGALDTAGMLTVWGDFNHPLPTVALDDAQMGGFHLCGLAAGVVTCVGYDGDGQVSGAPTTPMTALGVGYYHGCAIDPAKRLVCWGANGSGESDPP